MFKRGDQGVGYYRDHNSSSSRTAVPPVKVASSAKATRFAPFTFQCQETVPAVAVLVQVPSIDSSTVKITFARRLVQVQFSTLEKVEYALDLVPVGDIDAESSSFDVGLRNMCLALKKIQGQMWDDGDLVVSAPYSGELSSIASSGSVELKTPSNIETAINAMSFGTAASEMLFELD